MYAIGSIPRKSEEKYFNTAFVINPMGDMVTKMDKIHLFDIDIPGMFRLINQVKSHTKKAKHSLLEKKSAFLTLNIASSVWVSAMISDLLNSDC